MRQNQVEMAPAVSVIIPAYNRAETVRAAAESVLEQNFDDFELILVDDGSSDETYAVLSEMTDPRIRVLRHEVNKGASAARNTGIAAAHGDWVAFQDSDDIWLADKLDRQMAGLAAAGPKTVASFTAMAVIEPDAAGGRTKVAYIPQSHVTELRGDILHALAVHNVISTQTLIVRRDVLRRIGGFDEALPSLVDWDLVLRVAAEGEIDFIDLPLVHQFFSPNSLTRFDAKRTQSYGMIIDKHGSLFDRQPGLLSRHCKHVGWGWRRAGDRAKALTWLKRSWEADRKNVSAWGRYMRQRVLLR